VKRDGPQLHYSTLPMARSKEGATYSAPAQELGALQGSRLRLDAGYQARNDATALIRVIIVAP